MALRQQLTQKLEQRLSPQQIQLMKLLQVPTMELDQRSKQELEENPALDAGTEEVEDEYDNNDPEDDYKDDENEFDNDFDISDYFDDDTPDYKTQVNNKSKDDEERGVPLSVDSSFQDKLAEQLHLLDLDDTQFQIADTIIGNLDESGYLNRELDAIVDDLAFSSNGQLDQRGQRRDAGNQQSRFAGRRVANRARPRHLRERRTGFDCEYPAARRQYRPDIGDDRRHQDQRPHRRER